MVSQYISDLKEEFSGYNVNSFLKDLFAGVTVCAVALPLALAFGISSGADAAAGLITAIIGGFVISALSGTSYQISGPTGAMSAVLIPVALNLGLNGIFFVCLLAGLMLVAAGLFKLGRIISFIPSSVIAGFTAGISLIIVLGQLDQLLGIRLAGGSQIERMISLFAGRPAVSIPSLIIGAGVVVFMVLYPKKANLYFPSSLAAIILVVILNKLFHFPVSAIGDIPKSLILSNRLDLFAIDYSHMQTYLLPALSVACLGMVESLLCGACGGNMKGEKMNPDRELVAQGIGNILIPFFGGVPATAAIARTSVAIGAGSRTRLAGMIHSLGLVFCMLVLAPVISDIPLSALSGIMFVTAWRMNNWEKINFLFAKKYKTAIGLFLVTMICTVVFDLTSAIAIGVLIAMAAYAVKSCDVHVAYEDIDLGRMGLDHALMCKESGKCGVVYMTGSIFFLTSEKIYDKLIGYHDNDLLILSMRGISHVDVLDVQVLMDYYRRATQRGQKILFSSVQPKVMEVFRRAGLTALAGPDSFYFSVDKAILEHIVIKEPGKQLASAH